jgi:hypothetical protein
MLLWALSVLAVAGATSVCNISETSFADDCEWHGSWVLSAQVFLEPNANVMIMGNLTIASTAMLSVFYAGRAGGIGQLSTFGQLTIERGASFEWVTTRDDASVLASWSDRFPAVGSPSLPVGAFANAWVRLVDGSDPCVTYTVFSTSLPNGAHEMIRASESTCQPSSGIWVYVGGVAGFGLLVLCIYGIIRWCNRRHQQKVQAHVQMVDETFFNDES